MRGPSMGICLIATLLLGGCLSDGVRLEVVGQEGHARYDNVTCNTSGLLVTLAVSNPTDENIDLRRDRWEAVWPEKGGQAVLRQEGARNASPGTTVETKVFFCNSNGENPHEILLYDRPVYYTDDSTGAKVVARVTV